jgi:hypothetical protein
MIAVCILLTVAAAQPGQDALPMADNAPVRTVEDLFQRDTDLGRMHRGYLWFLDSGTELASAEEALNAQSGLMRFRMLSAAFDDALDRNREAQKQFDDYCRALADNKTLAARVDGLYRLQFSRPELRDGQVMGYLRAHPDDAMVFLKNPAELAPVPEPLYRVLPMLKQHPDLRDALRETFGAIADEAAAHVHVFPWWATADAPGGEVAESYRQLESHFAVHQRDFWVWHKFNVAAARNVVIRDWLRYWHRRVRRNPELTANYPRYLAQVRESAALRKKPVNKSLEPWPPDAPPPELLPIPPATEPAKKRVPTKEQLMPKPVARPRMPAKPGKPIPDMPKMPTRPHAPEKPGKEVDAPTQ